MIRLDLHTHSEASRDGGITPQEYAEILRDEKVDMIAITDHDRIDFALGMQKALGADRVIVGEEITTTDGDIIGLFLTHKIEPGFSAQETVDRIKEQNGLVYIPHPFETFRKGINKDVLSAIKPDVDIIEGHNGRAFLQNYSEKAINWARQNSVLLAASSDAHGVRGAGYTYTSVVKRPRDAVELRELLSDARLTFRRAPLYTLLYPKWNQFKNIMRGRG